MPPLVVICKNAKGVANCVKATLERKGPPPIATGSHRRSVEFNGVGIVRSKTLRDVIQGLLYPVRQSLKDAYAGEHEVALVRVWDGAGLVEVEQVHSFTPRDEEKGLP